MPERVETVARVGDRRIHRFQVVHQHLDDEGTREWVVVDVGEDDVRLASIDFEWTTTVALDAFGAGRFEPVTAGGVPVWGY